MVAARNKRLDQIVDYLRAKSRPVQVSELAQLLDCSNRSVHRYIDQLRNQSVPISSFLGPGGGLVLRSVEPGANNQSPNGAPAPEPPAKSFIGRLDESSSLDHALAQVVGGNRRIIALIGEAGIGKTRITEEFSARAEDLGVEQVWCTSQESQSTPPYWPWIQAIRQLSDDSRNTAVAELPTDVIRRVESLVSGNHATDHADESVDASAERFLLFDSLFQYLVASAASKSLVIVIEDIHWADSQSLQFLEHFAAQIESSRILIVATARNWQDGTSQQTLIELARHPGFVRHDIAKLTKQETRDLVHSLGKHEPGVDEKVYQLSEGNAFFTVELSRLLVTDDPQDSEHENPMIELPETIVATISQRISQLSEKCKLTLTFASVIGRQFELRELEGVIRSDLNSQEVRTAIDEATSVGVVRVFDLKNSSYEFGHALIQKTIYDTTAATKRQLIHRKLAEYYDSIRNSESGSERLKSAGEIAHHFIMSADRSKQAEIVKYSIRAGDDAEASYALDEAVDHYTSAVEYSNTQHPSPELADLYFKLGIACRKASQADKAIDNYIAAFNVYESIGDTANAIKMSYQAIGRGPGVAAHQIELCERGLKIVEHDSIDHAKILNEMGSALGSNQRQEEAIAALEQSVNIANANEEPELAAHALLNLASTHLMSLDVRRGADAITTGLRQLKYTDDKLRLAAFGTRLAVIAFMALGEPDESRKHSDELVRFTILTEHRGWPLAGFDEYLSHCLAMREGRWNDAIAIGERTAADIYQPWDFAAKQVTELSTGDPFASLLEISTTAELEKLGGDAMDQAYRSELFTIVAEAGRVLNDPEAIALAEKWAGSVLAHEDRAPMGVVGNSKLIKAIVSIAERNPTGATPAYEEFKKFRGLWLWGQRGISPDRLLALLAKTYGNNDLAKTHFEEAVAFCTHANYGPELAWVYHDYAELLIETGGNTAFRKAIGLLNKALIETDRLGMTFLGDRLRSMKDSLNPHQLSPDELSDREIEVLSFVSKGATNSEIARAIFVTENTVATHVANILAKTGTANRTEAAAYAAENQIVPRTSSTSLAPD